MSLPLTPATIEILEPPTAGTVSVGTQMPIIMGALTVVEAGFGLEPFGVTPFGGTLAGFGAGLVGLGDAVAAPPITLTIVPA